MPLQGCICFLMTFYSFSIFYCILFQYSTVLKTFLFSSLKACKQFVKSDENVSPILTKTDRHSGMYFVSYFYFCIMSWLSMEMDLVCDLMQCIVHGHIHLHTLWVSVSESGILLRFILQFNGFCKHLENFLNFHALFAQNAKMNALWEVTFFFLHVLCLKLIHWFHLHLVLMFTLKGVGKFNSGLYPAASSVLDMMLNLTLCRP